MTTQANTTNNRVFHVVDRSAFSLAPAGSFSAALCSLAFLGEHTRTIKKGDTEETKTLEYVGLGYEILDKNSGEVFTVVEEATLSYNPDSKLYSRILALNNGEPLQEGQSLNVLLGKPVKLTVQHRIGDSKDGGKRLYANVAAVDALPKTMQPHQLGGKPIYYDVLQPNSAMLEKLNRKHQAIIKGDSDKTKGANDKAQGANDQPNVAAAA